MYRIISATVLVLMAIILMPVPKYASAEPSDRWPVHQVWSTLLGGDQSEKGLSITLDSAGNLLVTGRTRSTDFPTTDGCYDSIHSGMNDVFVAKLNAAGTVLIWSTLLGGSGDDVIPTITVDAYDNPVLAGTTTSTDFPVTPEAYSTRSNGLRESWITKLDATGSQILWSTYYGGSNNEVINRVLVDHTGCPVIVGYTYSSDLPMTPSSHDPSYNGSWDAFVCRFSADGSQLLAATYLGCPGDDIGNGLALDEFGYAVVVGEAAGFGFPTTPGAFQTSPAGGSDLFVSKLDMRDATVIWTSLIGGQANDEGINVVLDSHGRPVVTGSTGSADFPVTTGAFSEDFQGVRDACVSVLAADGSSLEWSTFLGGSNTDKGWALAMDSTGNTVVVGSTSSADFPAHPSAFDPTHNGSDDVFIARFDYNGSSLGYCTYLGGEGRDEAYAAVMDIAGHLLVIGMTESMAFPTTNGAYQEGHLGVADAFIADFDFTYSSTSGVGGTAFNTELLSIYPNPFNPATSISFSLEEENAVKLEIYDAGGRQVCCLFDGMLSGGNHTQQWNGRDDLGQMQASGQYFARLSLGSTVQVRKMTLVR